MANRTWDVVVVGSGAAGLAAAWEAHQAGAKVLVVEKRKIVGGNTRISDGGLAAANNYLQKRKGVEDSVDLFREDIVRAGLGLNRPELALILARESAPTIDWTREVLGVEYLDRLDRFGGHSAARCLTTKSHSGKDLIKGLMGVIKPSGVEIRTRTRISSLLTDMAGRVTGIRIEPETGPEDQYLDLKATKGVILASGGFGADVPFRTLQNPALTQEIGTTNHSQATAETLISALRLGALPVHLSWIQLGPWGCPDETGYGRAARFASYAAFPTGIMVDPRTGLRIVNEWADRRQRAEAMLRVGRPCLGIVDSVGAELEPESLKMSVVKGKIREYGTLADLARGEGMPVSNLEQTVTAYNRLIQTGGRDEFGKDLGQATSTLDNPPYYALRLWPAVHYTPGGVGIDSKTRVLGLTGEPIPGLFAAGEVSGGVHGAARLGSCALTECLLFGRIAGREAAGAEWNSSQ